MLSVVLLYFLYLSLLQSYHMKRREVKLIMLLGC